MNDCLVAWKENNIFYIIDNKLIIQYILKYENVTIF